MKTALALVTVAGLALVAVAQPAKEAPKTATPAHTAPATATPATTATKAPAATPTDKKALTPEEEMKVWMEANTPGAQHAELAKAIGEWDMTIKSTNPMTGESTTEKATEKVEWLIEGRYVKVITTGVMGGMPFSGFGINGYNNITKQYETTWVDNMSTGQTLYTGTMDANHVLTLTGLYDDPSSSAKKTSKMVCTWTDANTRGFKMYDVQGGKDVLMMDATYTRKAGTTTTAKPVGAAPTNEHKPAATTPAHAK